MTRHEMTAAGVGGAAARPCSTTQIGHTAAPPTPGHAVGLVRLFVNVGSANYDSERPDHERDAT